jgi:hypothetical protein
VWTWLHGTEAEGWRYRSPVDGNSGWVQAEHAAARVERAHGSRRQAVPPAKRQRQEVLVVPADWEWEDVARGSGSWRPYATEQIRALSSACAEQRTLPLLIGAAEYTVDFDASTQKCDATGFVRSVRCNSAVVQAQLVAARLRETAGCLGRPPFPPCF